MKIPIELIIEAIESDECIGFCTECGTEHYGVEPDAENYPCEECESLAVCGCELLLIKQ